jgi:putative PIN family toxin of toxin-antitoxin system
VVLDTNTLLDWLLFQDPGMTELGSAIATGRLRWLACARMRDEFARTLGYAALAKWQPDSERLLSQFDRAALIRLTPPTLPALRCTDPDDQVFIDLAVAEGARWLVTHDRALLKLARRASALGVCITTPARWHGTMKKGQPKLPLV